MSGESSPPSLRVTSGFHFVDRAEAVEHALVQRAQQVQLALLQRGSSFARLEVGDGMLAFAAQRALVGSRQKAAAKQIESARRNQPALQHDEPGQIVALAAQTVSHPSAHARPALESGAGVHEVIRGGVLGMIGDHRADDGHVVDASGHVAKNRY